MCSRRLNFAVRTAESIVFDPKMHGENGGQKSAEYKKRFAAIKQSSKYRKLEKQKNQYVFGEVPCNTMLDFVFALKRLRF